VQAVDIADTEYIPQAAHRKAKSRVDCDGFARKSDKALLSFEKTALDEVRAATRARNRGGTTIFRPLPYRVRKKSP
jgi:hypothetical protein